MEAVPVPALAGRARWITGAIGLAIVVLAMLPPFVPEVVRTVLMDAFSAVCHQLEFRSSHVRGIQLAACDRCMGIYFGIPVAALLLPLLHRHLRRAHDRAPVVLIASVLPIAVDWGLEALGLLATTPASRWVTGLIFGMVAGYFLACAVSDFVRVEYAQK